MFYSRFYIKIVPYKLCVFYNITVTLGAFSLGNALAWTSPSLPRISQELCAYNSDETSDKKTTCDITGVTDKLAGWIGPLLPAGAILVGPLIGFFVDKFGRKWTMVALAIPTFAGWLLITISKSMDSIIAIYSGRILIGKVLDKYFLIKTTLLRKKYFYFINRNIICRLSDVLIAGIILHCI